MEANLGFKWAYVIVICMVLGRFFYGIFVEKSMDYYLMTTIILGTIAFLFGESKSKGAEDKSET
jgi:hypothetical protein